MTKLVKTRHFLHFMKIEIDIVYLLKGSSKNVSRKCNVLTLLQYVMYTIVSCTRSVHSTVELAASMDTASASQDVNLCFSYSSCYCVMFTASCINIASLEA